MDQSKTSQQNQRKSQNSDSSSEFHENEQCFESNSSSQTSKRKLKKKIRKNISKWRQNIEKKKNYKIVNTFIICHIDEFQNPKYIIQTNITDLKRKIRSIKPEQIEMKATKMAQKQRNSIMNQKCNHQKKKNIEKNNKINQTQPTIQNGMIYSGIHPNYMFSPMLSEYYGIRLPY